MTQDLVLSVVAGHKHLNRPYTRICIDSWRRIAGVRRPYVMISDGLREEDREVAASAGFAILPKTPPEVEEVLRRAPALRNMRGLPTWRHVIDSVICLGDAQRIILIDTDVFVTCPIEIDCEGHDYMYNCDDIPGYRGRWDLPFREPMVPTINPGFMVLNPRALDIDLLEHLARRYFVHSKNYWWTRQAALSTVVARSPRRALFAGEDVRVFSGNKKRTPEQIRSNRWKLLGDSRPMTDPEVVRRCMQGAAVLHLAGRGKNWLEEAQRGARDEGEARVLRGLPAPLATRTEAAAIALRMLLVQVGRRRRVPVPNLEPEPSVTTAGGATRALA